MTRESSQSTEVGTPENSAVSEVPPPIVRLQISAAKKLNLAAFQNAVPALLELAVVNDTESQLTELTIHLTSQPAFVKPRTWNLDAVGPGEVGKVHVKREMDGGVAGAGALHQRLRIPHIAPDDGHALPRSNFSVAIQIC